MHRVLVLVAVLFATSALPATANTMACGLKPLAPLGCSSSDARCICDAQGNCKWVFSC